LREPLQRLARTWQREFARDELPSLYFSPGRVNLMGAHLDYNGGPVMPVAIDRGTFLAVGKRGDSRLRLASLLEPGACEVELDGSSSASGATRIVRTGAWFDYPLGVAVALRREAVCGLDILYDGNLPIGGGLSSSASICVGTAVAMNAAWELRQGRMELIDAALWAEREFVGVKCGIMDPTSIGLARKGHLLWLDCRDRSHAHVPLDDSRLMIGVADSGVRRDLARGDFNERVEQCRSAFEELRRHVPEARCLRDIPLSVLDTHVGELSPLVAKRARHVLEEVERTLSARLALARGDLAELGRLMARTHQSLRDLFDVSLPELDCLAETALECDGVYGARLTGAGFGGCVVMLLHPRGEAGLVQHVQGRFERSFGRVPRVSIYHSADGPRELLI
jgi:galactokinase